MRAIGYTRVSTAEQAIHGISLSMQESRIRAVPLVNPEIDVLDVIVDDGYSAASLDRPGMIRVRRLIDDGLIDMLIISKLDRLTRSVKDLYALLDLCASRNVALHSMSESLDTSSATGRLVVTVMAAVTQWERETISERTREALAVLQSQGKRVGAVPFGWSTGTGRELVASPGEIAIIECAESLKRSGRTLSEIADELTRRGMTTRRGTPFSRQGVYRMLKKSEGADPG